MVSTFKTLLKNKHILQEQETPDDGLWSAQKRTGLFREIYLPIPIWT